MNRKYSARRQNIVSSNKKAGDKMKIGFIGAGKVGFSLGRFFATGGIHVTGFYSRRKESAKEAAAFCDAKMYDTPEEMIQESDAIFLTVPDGSISSVYNELKQLEISNKQICHCSGVMTVREAFPDISSTGAYGYSIHPLFPINSKYHTYRELTDAFFCLEGEGPHLVKWKELLESLGPTVKIITDEGKIRYHAACAIASNLMCALMQESLDLLIGCGFSRELALSALTPLVRSNLEHILQEGPAAALTGPLERGDISTVEKHLACFQTETDREMYRLLSQKLLQTAQEKNPKRDYRSMEELLRKA
ncbi:MAG: DUF2520 domain-containing protein [Lachnospiraceae bacterium]|nr:DUF2520 domain-containing protein [Lachnospiraceae bacterium]